MDQLQQHKTQAGKPRQWRKARLDFDANRLETGKLGRNRPKRNKPKKMCRAAKPVSTGEARAAEGEFPFPLLKTERTENTEYVSDSSTCSEDDTDYKFDGVAEDSSHYKLRGMGGEEEEVVPWLSPVPRSAPIDIPKPRPKREDLEYF